MATSTGKVNSPSRSQTPVPNELNAARWAATASGATTACDSPQRRQPGLSPLVGLGEEQVQEVLIGVYRLACYPPDLLRRGFHVRDATRPASGDDQPTHAGRAEQARHLDDVTTQGPAEQIDLREIERIDEVEQALGQTLNRGRRRARGPASLLAKRGIYPF